MRVAGQHAANLVRLSRTEVLVWIETPASGQQSLTPQDLVDAGFYVVLASLMWRFRSPAAAFTLLLIAIMRFFITVGMLLETEQVVWTYIIVTVAVIFAAIRGIEATLKLNGRFAAEGASDG